MSGRMKGQTVYCNHSEEVSNMDWTEAVREAVSYVEKHITEDITMYDVADHVHVSPFYFHKGFSILCGYSITEYIRNRRLALAGQELLAEDVTVMELAMKYGYDSPDSFTKAFTRFHGHSPSVVRRNKTMLKAFAPLKLSISLKGGYAMDYRIIKKKHLRFWQCQRNLDTKMQNRTFLLSGRSIMRRETGDMSAECLESTLIRKWAMSVLSI